MTFDPTRFIDKILVGDDCWEWTASKRLGYGRFRTREGLETAHRIAYRMFCGPIPERMLVCHSCDNRGCVKPSHLFLGTAADNMRDMVEKDRSPRNPGEGNPSAKLTNKQVLNIKMALSDGYYSQSDLARHYSVTPSAIHLIAHGKKWGWLR